MSELTAEEQDWRLEAQEQRAMAEAARSRENEARAEARRFAAQRDALQARITDVVAKINGYGGYGAGMMFHDELLAALQGDQPAEPDERLARMARPAEGVQLIADAFGIVPAEAAAQLRDAIRAAARIDLDEPGQPTAEADRG